MQDEVKKIKAYYKLLEGDTSCIESPIFGTREISIKDRCLLEDIEIMLTSQNAYRIARKEFMDTLAKISQEMLK